MTENEAKWEYCRAIDIIKKIKTEETHERYIDRHKAFDLAIQAIEEIQQYRAIGTIEEFKALKEKNVAKKPLNDGMQRPFSYYCPNCKEELSDDGYEPDEEYCCNCGQHIWVEN